MALVSQVANSRSHLLVCKPGTNVFRLRSEEHPEDETFPDLLIVSPEARVFFANAEQLGQKSCGCTLRRGQPVALDFTTAAALPTAGSTALQIIRDVISPKPGMSILMHGAAGVGSYASQIARNPRARVIGTATGADIEYLKSLGVDDVIDYKHELFENQATGMDAVVDLSVERYSRGHMLSRRAGCSRPRFSR